MGVDLDVDRVAVDLVFLGRALFELLQSADFTAEVGNGITRRSRAFCNGRGLSRITLGNNTNSDRAACYVKIRAFLGFMVFKQLCKSFLSLILRLYSPQNCFQHLFPPPLE